MRRIPRFLTWNREDQQLFLSALFLLGLMRLALRLFPFSKLRNLLAKLTGKKTKVSSPSIRVQQVVDAVNKASRYHPNIKCLARALATQILLSWWGQSSQLCIGVAKNELGRFEAHAWVEHEGKIIINNLADLSRYTKLPSWQEVTQGN